MVLIFYIGIKVCQAELENHYKTCKNHEIECLNNGCKVKTKRGEMALHATQCCFRVVECPFASYGCTRTNIIAKNLVHHLNDLTVIAQHQKLIVKYPCFYYICAIIYICNIGESHDYHICYTCKQ